MGIYAVNHQNGIRCAGFRYSSALRGNPLENDIQKRCNANSVNTSGYARLLQGCINRKALAEGKRVHAHIIKDGIEAAGLSLGNHLLHLYAKCESMAEAYLVFDKMQVRNDFSWNTMIAGYAKSGSIENANRLFHEMPLKSVFSWNTMIEGYVKCQNIEDARQLFDIMPTRNVFSWNTLIAGYANRGRIEDARQLFDKMPQRDGVSWNVIIAGYARCGPGDEALKLYWQMGSSGIKQDKFAFASVLSACAGLPDLEQGKQIHGPIIKAGFESDVFVESALVDMYAKCGCIESARQVFDKMSERDVVSWTAMISGYTYSGNIECARDVFDRMPERNVFSWNTMIVGYAQNGYGEEALKLFRQMQRTNIKTDKVTWASILRACASLAVPEQGRQLHTYIIGTNFQSDVIVGSALLDMYAKCGCLEDACQLFDEMHERDIVSWNAMIAAYAQNGRGKEALHIFEQMQQAGMEANQITFISVLSACNHAGLVDEGYHYFNSMRLDHCIAPRIDHYACMVDLLGRAGRLDEAENIINNMSVEANATIWGALLGACRIHGNISLAKRAAECLFKLEPQGAGPYMLLSNIYSAVGRWDDAAKIRKLMKEKGVKKNPGYSWIEVNNRVHTFMVGDRSHPEAEEIYAILERLADRMKAAGYMPDTSFVLHDVEEEYKEHLLCYHSEKLAIAFGLIRTPLLKPIRIFKNLRVCGDCHVAIKFISNIVGREIVVRDANRFHHFKGGLCSCRDYW